MIIYLTFQILRSIRNLSKTIPKLYNTTLLEKWISPVLIRAALNTLFIVNIYLLTDNILSLSQITMFQYCNCSWKAGQTTAWISLDLWRNEVNEPQDLYRRSLALSNLLGFWVMLKVWINPSYEDIIELNLFKVPAYPHSPKHSMWIFWPVRTNPNFCGIM